MVEAILLYFSIGFLWIRVLPIACDNATPPNFPPNIPITIGCFNNWDNSLTVPDLWVATPANEDDIVTLVNWAALNEYKLRPTGYQHNWSPFTVTADNPTNVVLVDTKENLNKIQQPSQITSTSYAVAVQTGASMLQFLTFLEQATPSLGVYACPAPGGLTVGGVIAIGGHGTGIPFVGETVPPGYAYGTLSNLIISFKVVVWDNQSEEYVLKTFERSDVDAKAFLVNLGRTFITEVTLMVGLNYNLRCKSSTDLTTNQLFAPIPGPNTLSSFLDESGRVETITFAFTSNPWLKVWTIEPQQPILSRKVTEPYNYPFTDNFPETLSDLLGKVVAGAWYLSPQLGQTQLSVARTGLLTSSDLWGPSKNLLLYVKSPALLVTANGYVVLTTRPNIQRVVNTFVSYHDYLVDQFQDQGLFPFNGVMEIRVTSLDEPNIVTNGESASLSAINPMNDHPEYDVAVWLDVLAIPSSDHLNEAMTMLEEFVFSEYDGTYASVRVEWSKGWAYTNSNAWTNREVYGNAIPSTFPNTTQNDGWDWTVSKLDYYDPLRIFTNPFIDELLQSNKNNNNRSLQSEDIPNYKLSKGKSQKKQKSKQTQ